MKSNPVMILRLILKLTLFAGWLAVLPATASAGAGDAPANCEVPAYLLTSESPLSKVETAIVSERKLEILVVGSRSSTINASETNA